MYQIAACPENIGMLLWYHGHWKCSYMNRALCSFLSLLLQRDTVDNYVWGVHHQCPGLFASNIRQKLSFEKWYRSRYASWVVGGIGAFKTRHLLRGWYNICALHNKKAILSMKLYALSFFIDWAVCVSFSEWLHFSLLYRTKFPLDLMCE